MSTDEAGARLDALAEASYASSGDAFAALDEATRTINQGVARSRADGLTEESVGDRLRRWIDKLEEVVRAIAKQLSAASYSIGVSWPAGVSVSISWAPTA